jgi:hypothetical protein
MYCPQCGQQQVSDVIRYCSRCGFLLDGVMTVLAAGGAIPTRYLQPNNQKPSARSKGIRQGAMLMLSTVLVVPIVAILSVNLLWEVSHIIVPLTALFCFVGGLLRILYALLMEDATPQIDSGQLNSYASLGTPQFNRPASNAALPPATVNPAPSWRPRPTTAEIYQPPPSITENTTRLLDKDDPKSR